jgi:hypothetical protein
MKKINTRKIAVDLHDTSLKKIDKLCNQKEYSKKEKLEILHHLINELHATKSIISIFE